jgi:G3E family GTPase
MVVPTERCAVALETVLEGPARVAPGAGEAEPAAPCFASLVAAAGFDADRARVERFLASLPPTVLRAKGFMRIDGEPRLVQYTAGQIEITPASVSGPFTLVFIGEELDEAALRAGLAETARR